MNLTLLILTLISILCITSSQRSYADADCNGNFIFSFSDDLRRPILDITQNPEDNNPTFAEQTFTLTNPPAGATSDEPGFESVSLDPTTGTIYAIIAAQGIYASRYLATVNMNAPYEVTIINEITPASNTLVGMSIDCAGNIFAVEKEAYAIYQINDTSGVRTFIRSGSRNCRSPRTDDCFENIGYHTEEGLLYRISSSSAGSSEDVPYRIYRLNADGTETESEIIDDVFGSTGYCHNAGSIKGMQYIGNDLWLISCTANFGGVRILDTSNFSRPIIGPIGNDSVVYDSGYDRTGSGLIATDASNALCTPVCPTTATPTTATPTTAAPTTDAPTTTAPTTAAPTTDAPTTAAPTTTAPTTAAPTTTIEPTTAAPDTTAATTIDTTTTTAPTTASPTTISPTTASPTTVSPTTISPTTIAPSTTSAVTTTITNNCPSCLFELSLLKISGVWITDDCPTTSTTTTTTTTTAKPKSTKTTKKTWSWPKYSEDSSSGSHSSDSSSDRRRMMGVYKDSSDSIDMCFIDGDPLIFVDDLCDDGWDKAYTTDSSSSEGSGDATTDEFLAHICVKYNVLDLVDDTDCGEINSIFLGLCTSEDTDFDITLLGTEDIDNILSEDGNSNVLSAAGARNDEDELGVKVILQNTDISTFKLCFEDVAVTAAFNIERDDLDIAENGAITFTDASGDTVSCTSLGLPCLNFFFGCDEDLIGPENGAIAAMYSAGVRKNAKHNCDCDRGMTAITLRYVGSKTAASIVAYNSRGYGLILCEFNNVASGEYITCTAKNTRWGKFSVETSFSVLYEDRRRNLVDIYDITQGDCVGIVKTSCAVQIIGDKLKGCNNLIVASHVDGDGALCNSQILALETDNSANALINNAEQLYSDPLKVLDELDPYIRWTLIAIMVTFVVLIFVSIYICFIVKRKKKEREESPPSADDILKTIEENKQKLHGMTKLKSYSSPDETRSTAAQTSHECNEAPKKQTSYDLNVEHEYYEEEEDEANSNHLNIDNNVIDDNVSGQFSSYR